MTDRCGFPGCGKPITEWSNCSSKYPGPGLLIHGGSHKFCDNPSIHHDFQSSTDGKGAVRSRVTATDGSTPSTAPKSDEDPYRNAKMREEHWTDG